MMGTKERHFAPLINVSVEQLVPQDHFYRHLERTLDLSFVREFVQKTYAHGGRPSIDPIVFFKLQLVMFFEGLRGDTSPDAACSRSVMREVVCGL
jgi:transposase